MGGLSMRGLCALLAALCVLGLGSAAWAHHVVSSSGVAWVEPVTVLEAELQAATFDFGAGRRGTWQSMALRAEVAVLPRLSVSARVPWSWVRFEDGRQSVGLADMELGARVGLVSTEHGELLLSAGLGAELPTGTEQLELGNGHVELSPFVVASSQLAPRWVLTGVLSWRSALGGGAPSDSQRSAHGAVIGPHSGQELASRLDLAWVHQGRWYLSGGAEAVVMVDAPADGPVVPRVELGFLPTEGVRVALGADLHAWGEARQGARGRLGLAWIF